MRLGHFAHVIAVLARPAVALVGAGVVAVSIAAIGSACAGRSTTASPPRPGRIAGEWASRSELAASLDPDALIEQTLAEVAALPGVDAASMLLERGRRAAHGALGLSAEEAERVALQTPREHEPARDRGRLPLPARRRRRGLGAPARRGGRAAPRRRPAARLARGAQPLVERPLLRRARSTRSRASPGAPAPRSSTARRFAEARQLADLDSLTGLYNRRSFHDVARSARSPAPAATSGASRSIVLDLDDFKRINDTVGHLAGDAVLAEVGRRILSLVRATDIACRFGGDEFAIILPESSRADAELLAERIVRAVAARPVEKAGPDRRSAGVAELRRRQRRPTSSTVPTSRCTAPRAPARGAAQPDSAAG